MLESTAPRLYASRLPLLEIAGLEAAPTLNGSCVGSPAPEAGTLQRLVPTTISPETKMISRPFGVQAELGALQGYRVSRLPFGLQVFGQVKQVNVRGDESGRAAKCNSAPIRRDRGRKIK